MGTSGRCDRDTGCAGRGVGAGMGLQVTKTVTAVRRRAQRNSCPRTHVFLRRIVKKPRLVPLRKCCRGWVSAPPSVLLPRCWEIRHVGRSCPLPRLASPWTRPTHQHRLESAACIAQVHGSRIRHVHLFTKHDKQCTRCPRAPNNLITVLGQTPVNGCHRVPGNVQDATRHVDNLQKSVIRVCRPVCVPVMRDIG